MHVRIKQVLLAIITFTTILTAGPQLAYWILYALGFWQ